MHPTPRKLGRGRWTYLAAGRIAVPNRAIFAVPFAAHLLCAVPGCFAGQLRALTIVELVRLLPAEQAKSVLPVRMRGQVLAPSGGTNSFFFSDGRTGISFDRNGTLPELYSGDEVEVAGKTSAGLFAPMIVSDRVRVLGKAQLPPSPDAIVVVNQEGGL